MVTADTRRLRGRVNQNRNEGHTKKRERWKKRRRGGEQADNHRHPQAKLIRMQTSRCHICFYSLLPLDSFLGWILFSSQFCFFFVLTYSIYVTCSRLLCVRTVFLRKCKVCIRFYGATSLRFKDQSPRPKMWHKTSNGPVFMTIKIW